MTPSAKLITAAVLLIHGAILFLLTFQKGVIPLEVNSHKVVVNTVTLAPPQKKAHVVQTKPKIVKKTETKKKSPLNTAKAKKLQEARDALANLKTTTAQKSAKIEYLTVTSSENNYTQSLVRALKAMLTLPEFGEVKIAITLDRKGHVTKLEMLGAESSLNKKKVERVLKEAKFSSFGSNFSGEKEHTFAIVLKNDL